MTPFLIVIAVLFAYALFGSSSKQHKTRLMQASDIRIQRLRQRRTNVQIDHAKWAARQIADNFVTYHDPTLMDDNACHARLGQYLVPKAAWPYATQYARKYANQRILNGR